MKESYGGGGGIRTLGSLRYVGFQDRCIKPDSATPPRWANSQKQGGFWQATNFKKKFFLIQLRLLN